MNRKKFKRFVFNDHTVTKKGDMKPPFFENKISLGLLEF